MVAELVLVVVDIAVVSFFAAVLLFYYVAIALLGIIRLMVIFFCRV